VNHDKRQTLDRFAAPPVARTFVYEMATQIAEAEGLERLKAQEVGAAMVKGLTDW